MHLHFQRVVADALEAKIDVEDYKEKGTSYMII